MNIERKIVILLQKRGFTNIKAVIKTHSGRQTNTKTQQQKMNATGKKRKERVIHWQMEIHRDANKQLYEGIAGSREIERERKREKEKERGIEREI